MNDNKLITHKKIVGFRENTILRENYNRKEISKLSIQFKKLGKSTHIKQNERDNTK